MSPSFDVSLNMKPVEHCGTLAAFMILSDLIQDLEPVSSRSPHSKRKRAHMVEANYFRHFLSQRVEDPVSNTETLPTVLDVENLSRAGRLGKNSKCWQRRQPRLFHTYQSHVESYTVLHCLTVNYVLLSDQCHHCEITSES